MPSPLDISVIVSTYQRPRHLRRCLASLAAQRDVAGRFEVIVADDGSRDETADMVAAFRETAPFPVKFCTHPHEGFQLARSRNSGIRESIAPYLLFTDGDCIFPPDHLRRHLDARRTGVARAGDCVRIDEATSDRIDEAAVRSGEFLAWIDARQRRSLRRTYLKSLGYQALRNSQRPKLTGWNMAVWREHLDAVNGFDEKFRGWGCEDDDLAARLRMIGVRIRTAIGYTHGYHLWHPPHATTPQRWNDGANVQYLRRPLVLPRCLEGIRSRRIWQVSVRVVASPAAPQLSRELASLLAERSHGPEIEVLVWPNPARFTASRACRVLVAPQDADVPASLARSAHATIRLGGAQDAAAVRDALQRLLSHDAADASASRAA